MLSLLSLLSLGEGPPSWRPANLPLRLRPVALPRACALCPPPPGQLPALLTSALCDQDTTVTSVTTVTTAQDTAACNDYLPVAGLPELNTAIAAFHKEWDGVELEEEGLVVGPGSKELIFLTMAVFKCCIDSCS